MGRVYAVPKWTESAIRNERDCVPEHSVLVIVLHEYNPTTGSLPPGTAAAHTDADGTMDERRQSYSQQSAGSKLSKAHGVSLPFQKTRGNNQHGRETTLVILFAHPGDKLKDPALHPSLSPGRRPQDPDMFFHWQWSTGKDGKTQTCRPGKQHQVITTTLRQALQMNVGQNA